MPLCEAEQPHCKALSGPGPTKLDRTRQPSKIHESYDKQCYPPRGIHTVPEYTIGVAGEGIPDPYGLTMAAYRSTLRQLYEYVERVVDRL